MQLLNIHDAMTNEDTYTKNQELLLLSRTCSQ